MASLPSSELRFRGLDGTRCEPREWTPLLLELPGTTESWTGWTVTVNGERRPLSLRNLAGAVRCVCEWPESCAGRYQIAFEHPDHSPEKHRFVLQPAKLGEGALPRLLEDLEHRLPHALAATLQRGGALAGMELRRPGDVSPAAELARLRQLLEGGPNTLGLVPVLRRIAPDPHWVLVETAIDVPQERARRPHPVLLRQSMAQSRQIDDDGRPLRVWDRRVEPSYDVYENRLLKLLIALVRHRLERLAPLLPSTLEKEAENLIAALDRARSEATFLDAVTVLQEPPTQVTQILLHRAAYRRLLDLWRELSASLEVRLGAAALDTPLQSVPALYELWSSLVTLAAIVAFLKERGFRITHQRLVRRLPQGPMVELVQNQDPVLESKHSDGTAVHIHFQRSFGPTGGAFASLSFEQRPDLVVETRYADGTIALLILDPKYKIADRGGTIGPAKADIDKMHAYRDAIFHRAHGRVVRHAAILYPGPSRDFGGVVSAISADPLHADALAASVCRLFGSADRG